MSEKQRLAAGWWLLPETRQYDAIICDGAVRSGKTMAMSLGFVCWAMTGFDEMDFAFCGKTVTALRRNLITPLLPLLKGLGFRCREIRSRGLLELELSGRKNRFYLFGGKDESAAALIQGVTLAGVLLDEVALMPRSFVEQALARCSVSGSRLWFSCNPDHPRHWFYLEWIQKAKEKHALYLHFTMEDNPALSPVIRARYERLYAGAFYDRFVLGKWTASAGLVYPMFSESEHVVSRLPHCSRYVISCDYGTVNPTSCGLWGEHAGTWYRLKEYYYDARREGAARTDEEHYAALEALAGSRDIECVVADPSAASFLTCIRRHGRFQTLPANNDVLTGIRLVSDALREKRLLFSAECTDTLREFSLYRWNEKASGDAPIKEFDHAMDDIRYFTAAFLHKQEDPFCVIAAPRTSNLTWKGGFS